MNFINDIRKYQLNKLLEISSDFSRRLFNNGNSVAKISLYKQSEFINGWHELAGSTYLPAWYLVDISYHAIKESDDFKQLIPCEHDFFNLYNQFLKYDGKVITEQYKNYEGIDRQFYMLFGLSQKTFWFQEMYRLASMNARFYELLYEIPKRNNSIPQFYLQIERKYRVDFTTYDMACRALLWVASTDIYFRFPYNIDSKLGEINIDNALLEKMILDYMGDYEIIRKRFVRIQTTISHAYRKN